MIRFAGNRGGRGAHALGLLCVCAALFATGCRRGRQGEAAPQPAAARVDGAAIPLARVQLEIDRLRRGSTVKDGAGGGEEGPAQIESKDLPRLGRALLDGLIDRALILQRAKAAGLTVSEAEVQRATDALADSIAKSGISFQQQLERDGQTPEALADELRDRLVAEKWVDEQVGKERASPAEARAFYEAHRGDYDAPEMVHCQQIAVRSADEAKSLLDQLRKGASFEQLARAHGVSPDAKAGGDLGFFARGTMPKPFDEACFALKPGGLSGVVESPYGYHVFKLVGRRAPKHLAFDEVKDEVARRATREKRSQAERELLKQLRQKADIQVDDAALARLR